MKEILSQFEYDEKLAKDLAAYSNLSYLTDEQIISYNCGSICRRNVKKLQNLSFIYNPQEKAKAFIGFSTYHQAIIISFRGSDSLANWQNNFNGSQSNYPLNCKDCKVHSGFLRHYKSIEDELISDFLKIRFKYPFSKVYVSGHSLGGAAACLFLPKLYEIDLSQQIDVFYTFGQPPVGNQYFMEWFNQSNFARLQVRITNRNDIVTKNILYFFHVSYEIVYNDFSDPTVKYEKCYWMDQEECRKDYQISISSHTNYFGWQWPYDLS